MTDATYRRVKALLLEQKRQIMKSPEAAYQLITELGIRDILVDPSVRKTAAKKKAAAVKKATPKKVAPKKVAAKKVTTK